jgi:hypothetical protein
MKGGMKLAKDCWARNFSLEQAEKLTGFKKTKLAKIYHEEEKNMRKFFLDQQETPTPNKKTFQCRYPMV